MEISPLCEFKTAFRKFQQSESCFLRGLKENIVANADMTAIKTAVNAKSAEPVLTALELEFALELLLLSFVLVCEFGEISEICETSLF